MIEQKPYDLHILYAEDDATTREEISLFLKRRAREVSVARDGAEGLALFRKTNPDIIVTDIRMPVMDGLKMLRMIRQENKGIPITVTSAYSDTSYMLESIEIGVDQYVMKPVDTDKLEAAIYKCAEIIEYRRAHKRFLAERETLINELQEALSKVKLLSGFLPICAFCKKIRNDKGYWQQIESYIRDNSEAEFTHGYCPECAAKAMADIQKLKKRADNT